MTQLSAENATQAEQHAKQFTLQDSTGSTRLVFYPRAPLPGAGAPAGSAQVEYHGPEGDFTFRGEAVTQQTSPLGQLITVTLIPNADAGQLDPTLTAPGTSERKGEEDLWGISRSYGFLLSIHPLKCLDTWKSDIALPYRIG
jgi:hypothetical protein